VTTAGKCCRQIEATLDVFEALSTLSNFGIGDMSTLARPAATSTA
jgi:hypothetical protein